MSNFIVLNQTTGTVKNSVGTPLLDPGTGLPAQFTITAPANGPTAVVDGLEAAIQHIEHYGSHHTDSILTDDEQAAETFLNALDSAIVLWNASTQFADGGEFGMGAEIGIGTGKLHARGPVGIEQLTTFKYVVRGNGQIRS